MKKRIIGLFIASLMFLVSMPGMAMADAGIVPNYEVEIQVESGALIYYWHNGGFVEIVLASWDNIRFTPNVLKGGQSISDEIVNITYFLGSAEYDTLEIGELGTFHISDLMQNWEIGMYIELADGTVITHWFGYLISIVVP